MKQNSCVTDLFIWTECAINRRVTLSLLLRVRTTFRGGFLVLRNTDRHNVFREKVLNSNNDRETLWQCAFTIPTALMKRVAEVT